MGSLNPIRFELKRRHVATVQRNGYVRLESHYYSVPYRHIGKKVNILYNSEKVEIYLKYEKVAVHQRGYKPYGYTHDVDHLAPSQRPAFRAAGLYDECRLAMIAAHILWRKAHRFVIARPQRGRGNLVQAAAISPMAFQRSNKVLRDSHVASLHGMPNLIPAVPTDTVNVRPKIRLLYLVGIIC